jgi:hypothetical protein
MAQSFQNLLQILQLRVAANQGALVRRQIAAKTISSTVRQATQPKSK